MVGRKILKPHELAMWENHVSNVVVEVSDLIGWNAEVCCSADLE